MQSGSSAPRAREQRDRQRLADGLAALILSAAARRETGARSVSEPAARWSFPRITLLRATALIACLALFIGVGAYESASATAVAPIYLRGVVADASGGPISTVAVGVSQAASAPGSAGARIVGTATTDQAGTYRILLKAAGTYRVRFAPAAGSLFIATSQNNVVVGAGGATLSVTLPGRTIAGTVVDTGYHAVKGETVSAQRCKGASPACSTAATTTTNAVGAYALPVPIGTYRLLLTGNGVAAQWAGAGTKVAPTPGGVSPFAPPKSKTVTLLYELSGVVATPSGNAIADAAVQVFACDGGKCAPAARATTDQNGRFRLLAAGTTEIRITVRGVTRYVAKISGTTPTLTSKRASVSISASTPLSIAFE
jgi:carboxypeptidase family protein